MKIDENRNITIDLNKDEVISLNSGMSIVNENGIRITLPYEKIKNQTDNIKKQSE